MAQLVDRKPPKSLLTFEWVPAVQLKLPNRALRRHSPRQETMLMNSFAEFGMITPIIVDDDDNVVSGVLRLQVARKLKLEHVPILRVGHLSPAQLKAFQIADNKLQEHGVWDEEALRDALAEVLDNQIDLDALGFTIAEADILLAPVELGSEDEALAPPASSLVEVGDIFEVGPHRVMCGDALKAETYARLMGTKNAAMVFTDPPFNVGMQGHITGKGRVKHRDFVMANGEMSDAEFQAFLRTFLEGCTANVRIGGLVYVAMDWRGIRLLLSAGADLGLELINLVVWAKTNAGMGSFYRSQHELIAVFRVPGAGHRNNVELGRHGRHRSNVWSYAGANAFGGTRDEDLAMHPTVKPVDMIMDAIKDCTKRDDIVLDAFGGSGGTLVAAQKVGRIAHVSELDPIYVETMLRRYQRVFGIEAVHAESGLKLTDILASREAEANVRPAPPPIRRRLREALS